MRRLGCLVLVMFSAPQPGQGSSPWAQKTNTAPFGTPGSMNFGNTSFGAAPATPAQSQPGFLQPQGNNAFTPQTKLQTPQSPFAFGQPGAAGTPQNPSEMQYSPAPSQPMNAQQSPMQPGQAPVNYLPGYLSKMRGAERVSPSDSPQPSSSTHRPIESTSPPARDADTSLALASKDTQPGARTAPSTSPVNRFSSSFFNTSLGPDDSRLVQTPPPPGSGVREGSIFGYGGLRGSRKQDEPDPSAVLRAPSEPPTSAPASHFFGTDYGGSAMDDDDAPPVDTLTDMAQQPALAFDTSLSGRPAAPPEKESTTEAPLGQRTVLVFGFPAHLYARVVEQFATIGGLQASEEVPLELTASETPGATDVKPTQGALPSVVRLIYAAPYQALMAVRRSGQPFANACMLGVRWESDALHELSLVKGLDAPLVENSGPAPTAPSTPAVNRVPADTKVTPLFGRPIDVVGTPVSAMARKNPSTPAMTPLRAAVHASEAWWRGGPVATAPEAVVPGAPAPPKSVLGRLADGLFGW